jgi:hypothetical protein
VGVVHDSSGRLYCTALALQLPSYLPLTFSPFSHLAIACLTGACKLPAFRTSDHVSLIKLKKHQIDVSHRSIWIVDWQLVFTNKKATKA